MNRFKIFFFSVVSIGVFCGMLSAQSYAGGFKWEDGDKYCKVGGRIQLQYHTEEPSNGSSEDELFLRRFRPYIEGSVHPDWKGKFQIDFGKSKTALKDAYLQYKGLDGMKITVGNANFPFSQELLTSSKYQQLVERTFVGDHNYGIPDRQTGIHLTGENGNAKIIWGASIAMGAVDPSNTKLDFDTVVQIDKGDDWSEGPMIGARIDFHPLGKLKFSQGDFKGEQKARIGAAAFVWNNDDDNLDPTREDDVGSANGFEVSGAYRNAGFSVDVQYNIFNAELVDAGITDGLYADSETELTNFAVEGGYMVIPKTLEIIAGYQMQDADGYADTWTRTSFGLNYFFVESHDIKMQLTYRIGASKDGKTDNDVDEIFLQMQYVF